VNQGGTLCIHILGAKNDKGGPSTFFGPFFWGWRKVRTPFRPRTICSSTVHSSVQTCSEHSSSGVSVNWGRFDTKVGGNVSIMNNGFSPAPSILRFLAYVSQKVAMELDSVHYNRVRRKLRSQSVAVPELMYFSKNQQKPIMKRKLKPSNTHTFVQRGR